MGRIGRILVPCGCVVLSVLVCILISLLLKGGVDGKKAELGVSAVKLLYDFGSPEQLNYQMVGLKEITTEAVFNQLTIDNTGRTLNTYLKFKNKPVTVCVDKSTDQYVIYHLETEHISPERVFVFFFSVNSAGFISEVREVEAVDFVTSYN